MGLFNAPPMPQLFNSVQYFLLEDRYGKTPYEKLSHDLGIYPYRYLYERDSAVSAGQEGGPIALEGMRERRVSPTLYIDEAARRPALTLVNGLTDTEEGLHGVLLFDEAGTVIHHWPVKPELAKRNADPNAKIVPHAVHPMPDGSLIVVSDFGSRLARLDACGAAVWAIDAYTHHSIAPDGPDHAWTWDRWDLIRIRLADGSVVRRFSVEELIAANPDLSIFETYRVHTAHGAGWLPDQWHANDIDPLPARFAGAFPGFEAGDLALSFRSLNLIAVVDPDTLKVRWWRNGIARRQHDPDWMADGRILYFDNNTGEAYSHIRAIDPQTYEVETVLDGSDYDFYTSRRGRQQMRADGSLLITSPEQGRVFEVAPDGAVVFEFVNRYDEAGEHVGIVSDALALPPDFYKEMPRCD